MNHARFTRPALAYLWNAVSGPSSALVLALVVLSFLAKTAGPTVLPETAHSDTCRTCDSSSPEARADRDAFLIGIGAIQDPTESDHPREQDGVRLSEHARLGVEGRRPDS